MRRETSCCIPRCSPCDFVSCLVRLGLPPGRRCTNTFDRSNEDQPRRNNRDGDCGNMGIELTPAFWSGLLQIILVNIILSGDNALVIALACRNLDKRHQKPAILIGSAGAIVLRIIFVLIIDQLLKIGYLKLIGGLLLLWIGVRLVQGEEEHEDGVKAAGSLWGAVRTIIIADAVMSLDNAIAIAAAAHGDTVLIVLGLIIS